MGIISLFHAGSGGVYCAPRAREFIAAAKVRRDGAPLTGRYNITGTHRQIHTNTHTKSPGAKGLRMPPWRQTYPEEVSGSNTDSVIYNSCHSSLA